MFASRPMFSKLTLICALLAATGFALAAEQGESKPAEPKEKPPVPAALNFTMKNIDGNEVPLSKYQGKVVLMVNVASHCGYTKQYKDLEALHEKYAEKGLSILGFPANEFGKQEPGTDSEIKEFCTSKFDVKFDMFSKIVVKGEGIHPLYQYLTDPKRDAKTGSPIGWNFEKFLIARDGTIIAHYKSGVIGDELVKAIETELAKK